MKPSLLKEGGSKSREDFSVHPHIFRTHTAGRQGWRPPTFFVLTFARAPVGSIHESTAGFAPVFHDLLEKSSRFLLHKNHRLAAARSRLGSDSPPDCHSLPRRHYVTFSKEGFFGSLAKRRGEKRQQSLFSLGAKNRSRFCRTLLKTQRRF